MPLELRRKLDGSLRRYWYGRYEVNGERPCVNLGIKLAGTPPASLTKEGDVAFERSRAAAQSKLDSISEEARSKRSSINLSEKIYEHKTGAKIKSVKLKELIMNWAQMPRRRPLNERYAKQCQSTLQRFIDFVNEQNPKAREIVQVSTELAEKFMAAEEERGITSKTWNDVLKLLRSTFRRLLPHGFINPFGNLVTKDTDTVFRIPFNPEELKYILDAAKQDAFILPIIIVGICTAMRRNDCCLLRWKSVDLKNGYISVKTSKTGVTVDIPIFPLLYDELSDRYAATRQPNDGKEGEFVFPEQAATFSDSPDDITKAVKMVLASALGNISDEKGGYPKVSTEEIKKKGHEYIDRRPDSAKKNRMRTVFDLYVDGKKNQEIMAISGASKAAVSGYLNEIEKNIACRVIRGRADGKSFAAQLRKDGFLNVKRDKGQRKASIRDFQSFRVTWVTLALTADVPLELVKKVTGHQTIEIVLKHYFKPGREDFRRALEKVMPKLLTGGNSPLPNPTQVMNKAIRDEMREIIVNSTPESLNRDKVRLLSLLEKV